MIPEVRFIFFLFDSIDVREVLFAAAPEAI